MQIEYENVTTAKFEKCSTKGYLSVWNCIQMMRVIKRSEFVFTLHISFNEMSLCSLLTCKALVTTPERSSLLTVLHSDFVELHGVMASAGCGGGGGAIS